MVVVESNYESFLFAKRIIPAGCRRQFVRTIQSGMDFLCSEFVCCVLWVFFVKKNFDELYQFKIVFLDYYAKVMKILIFGMLLQQNIYSYYKNKKCRYKN